MTKQELEKAIENGESVWIIGEDIQGKKKVGTKRLIKYDEIFNNKLNGFWCLNKIFKTKVEAEHYLYHANVKRVEKLPFVTWEEFLEKKEIEFTDINGRQVLLYKSLRTLNVITLSLFILYFLFCSIIQNTYIIY